MKAKTFKTIIFVVAATLSLCSCQKMFNSHAGDSIRFTAGSGFSQTRAVYSGEVSGNKERIDWETGDLLRIYCAQVSEPTQKFADYKVISVDSPASGAISTAHIETFSDATDGIGLRWGEGDHTFYAAFPSPAASGVTASISGNDVTANLSGSQAPAEVTGSGLNYTAVADLNNMLMTAKAGPITAETMPDENNVFLAFTPLTTAVKFTITNQSKAALTLKSVSLISASSALNGPFTVDIDDESHQPEPVDLGGTAISYIMTYPYCQYAGTVSDATKKVTINFATPVTLPYDADTTKCGSLTFTFFLQPCQNFNDLTFKLTKSDESWMSTKLGYTDGTGILFPRFKKTEVNGVFVPEGAQWTVKYAPTVQSWNQSSTDIDPMPETAGDPFVTSWDTGVEDDLELKDSYNGPVIYDGHECVEIAGLKWATMNVGATTPKDYGWYFHWGGTEGYEYFSAPGPRGDIIFFFKPVNTSDPTPVLTRFFSWPYAPFNNHSPLYDDTYFNSVRNTVCPNYTLALDYDAAHVNWGGNWRMPTQLEFKAMKDATYWEWDSEDQGYYVYTPNPSSDAGKINSSGTGTTYSKANALLFFPAAGYGKDATLYNDEDCPVGEYWSSSLSVTMTFNWAEILYFSSNEVSWQGPTRCTGCSVRPVAD